MPTPSPLGGSCGAPTRDPSGADLPPAARSRFRASTSSGYGTVTSHPSRATSTGEGSSSSSACRSWSSRTRWAPVSFGSSVLMASGNEARLGAFSVTWIDVRSDAEAAQVVADTRAIMPELARMEGFVHQGFALGGQTGVYVSHRTDHEWTRCESCGVMLDGSEDLSTCRCGHAVAARPPMW